MTRILMISAESPDAPWPTRVSSLAEQLVLKRHEVFLLSTLGRAAEFETSILQRSRKSSRFRSQQGVVWILPPTSVPKQRRTLGIAFSIGNILSSILFAIAHLTAERINVIYGSTALSQGFIATVLSGLWSVPLITDYGDPSFARDRGLIRGISYILESLSLNHSKALIASDPVIAEYVGRRTRKTPALLPNGKMDLSIYRLDILLESFKQVVAEIPDVRLRLVGVGPDVSTLRTIVSNLQLTEHVDFVGLVSHSKIPDQIRNSSVCVHLTNDACLGQKVIEYMASGKPIVIASPWWNKYESTSVIRNEYNCMTTPLNANTLATALIRSMRDKRFSRNLAQNALKTPVAWSQTTDTLIRLIESTETA